MRVMFLNPTGQLGGAETSLLEVLTSIGRAEPSWSLWLLAGADGPLIGRASSLGVNTIVLPFPPAFSRIGESGAVARQRHARLAGHIVKAAGSTRRYLAELAREIRQVQPDLLHTNGLKMHLLGAMAGSCRTLVWHLHDYIGPRPVSARLLRWQRAKCAMVVTNSRSVAADARGVLGDDIRIVPVHNGVDLARFSPQGELVDLDAMAGLPSSAPGTVRVGLLGTFARWKGHLTFLEALARLPRELRVRAYIIGDALYETDGSQHTREELTHAVERLGIADRVGLTGFVARPERVLRSLDIVVHASTAPEPFGLVIAEAMASGRAVVFSEAGGAAEIAHPGVDALGHAPGDVAGLAEQIAALVRDPVLRARIGEAARETAVQSFDRDRIARELIPLYRSAMRAA